jgi:uncharacterized membrane protein
MALSDTRSPAPPPLRRAEFSASEIGALAHLYRGEVYRSTVWRTRLDSSTNWAVVTTGIALSATYSSASASPLPMLLVGLLVGVFLLFEARRYRYFNVWRARARLLETDFYAPLIRGQGAKQDAGWTELLARDYLFPQYHISFARAVGRRLRRTYAWIFTIQAIAYYGKLAIHPAPLTSLADILDRAAIGPIPGAWVVAAGVLFHGGWAVLALITWRIEMVARRARGNLIAMG